MSIKLYDAEIEYLYSSGTGQYINTLIPYDSTVVVEGSVKLAGAATGNYMFGIYTTVGGSTRRWAVNCATTTSVLAHFGTVTNVWVAFSRNIFHSIRADYRYFSVDGTVTNTKAAAFTPERDVNIYLFARSNNNNADCFRAVYIGDFKIYKGKALVRDYIPVRVGNVGYLFDKVSMKLFGNAGTGSFVLGPDVAPGRYANEIAFLESTGSQYIDTGVSIDTNTKLVVDGKFTDALSTVMQCHGAIHDNSGTYNRYHIGNAAGDSTFFQVGLGTAFGNSITKDSIRHTFQLLGSGTAYIDSNQFEGDSSVPNLNIYLFARNFDNEAGAFCEFILYSAKIYSGDTLVRDFIPVEYNNIGYLYDKVSGEFFANQGTGKFVLGHRAPRFDGKACARSYTRRQLMMDIVGIKPYISNGLVFHLDGADATDTTWVDRIGGNTFTNDGSATHDGKGVRGSYSSPTAIGIRRNVGTIEVCGEIISSWAGTDNTVAVVRDKDHIYGLNYLMRPRETRPFAHISSRNTIVAPRSYRSVGIGKFTHSLNIERHVFNGTLGTLGGNTYNTTNASSSFVGHAKVRIYQVRIYNRLLTEAEMKYNQEQDRKKYGIQF